MKVSELGEEVLKKRDEEGVRGVVREISRFNCHIKPSMLGDRDVETVTPRDVREWYRWMAARDAMGRYGGPRKLSKATIGRCSSLLSAIFVEAVERDLRDSNPCTGTKPRSRADASDTVEKWTYLTEEEQVRLWACEAIPRADRLMMMIACKTGMRPCEQFNMRLADFVVDGPEPHANVRLSHPQKGKDAPPKNGKRRKVPLMGLGLEAAREWLALLPTYAPENPHGLVFPTPSGCRRQQGKWLIKSTPMRAIYALADIPTRPALNWYALRHTFATNLISGADGRYWRLEEIQVLMGHSTVAMTQRYAHLGETAIKKAVREANAAMAASTQSAPELALPVVALTAASSLVPVEDVEIPIDLDPSLPRSSWVASVWTMLAGILEVLRRHAA